LSHLDLARVDRYHTGVSDVKPSGDFLWQCFAEASAAAAGLLRRPSFFQDARNNNAAASELQELPSARLEAVRGRGSQLISFWFGCGES
jgi:hypothetical protein